MGGCALDTATFGGLVTTVRDYAADQGTAAVAEPLSDDAGYFWFSRRSNPELAVKILDGRAVNGLRPR